MGLGLDNPLHIAFILILVLLVFGAKRLPEMGRSLGAGMRGFRDSLTGESPAENAGESRSSEPATLAVRTATTDPILHTAAPVAAEPVTRA
jgi:sec-independent protein translocase protein TatA